MQKARFIVLPLSLKLADSRLYINPAHLDYSIRGAIFNRDKKTVETLAPLMGTELARHYRALATNSYRIEYIDLKVGDSRRASLLLACSQLLTRKGNLRDSMRLCVEAHRLALNNNDWLTAYMAQKDAGVIRAITGDHKGALADLESLERINRYVGSRFSFLRYDYLNSLAVELNEVNRVYEASRISRTVLSSPMIGAYPEWIETASEISEKIPRKNRVGFSFPESDSEADTPGEVVDLAKYKSSRQPVIKPSVSVDLREKVFTIMDGLIEKKGEAAVELFGFVERVFTEDVDVETIQRLHNVLDKRKAKKGL